MKKSKLAASADKYVSDNHKDATFHTHVSISLFVHGGVLQNLPLQTSNTIKE